MDIPPTSKTADFRNWLKGASALKLAKEGLTNFVETEINELRTDLIQSVIKNNELPSDVTCTQCTTANLLPCPTPGFCNRVRCEVHGYHSSDQKPNQPCPNGLCNDLKNAIEKEHRFHSPSWKNSDARRWSTDAMEICKCFLPSCGYDKINSINDIDFNGILSIVINNRRFQLKMASALSTQRNVCTKARDVGKAIRLSKNCELSDMELSQHIEVLKDLFSDQEYLANDDRAGNAIEELTKLQKTLPVTTFSLQDMMRELQDILRAQVCDLHEEILENIEKNSKSATIQKDLATIQKELTDLLDRVVKQSKSDLRNMEPELKNFRRYLKQNIDEKDKDDDPGQTVSTSMTKAEDTSAVPDRMPRSYVDNPYNRRLGRVGKPVGSMPVSKGSSSGGGISSSGTHSSKKMSDVFQSARNNYRGRADNIIFEKTGQRMEYIIVDTPTGREAQLVGLTPHPSDAGINPDCTSTEPTKQTSDKETQLITKTDHSGADINPECTSTEPTKEIPDKETQLLSKKWEDYLQGLDEDKTITIESLIDELGLPTTDQLNKLQGEYLKTKSKKTSNLLKTIEHRVCKGIMSNNKDIQYAWLAYTAEKTIDVQLIAEVKQFRSKIICENVPYRPKIIQFDDYSKEAELLIAKCEENESFEDFDAIQDCINANAQELVEKHKHLSIINASTVRSKDFYKSGKVNDIKENCIALYVRRKGLIPVGEEPFEGVYGGFPIDVREGVFYPSMQAENERSSLKMGLRVKADENVDYGGTLGGFIDHPQYGVCGFTCSHALLDKFQMNKLSREHEMTGEQFPGEINVYLNRDSPVKTGHVVIAILTSGDKSTPGMDVAFFQIDKRLQVGGVLVDVNNAADNEIFDSGKVYLSPMSKKVSVFKYGSYSGRTDGEFLKYSAVVLQLPVKPEREESLDYHRHVHVLLNQLVILGNQNKQFSEDGDSGSLVIMDEDNGERFGIGIVEGIASYGVSFATPLGPILEKVGLSSLKRFAEDIGKSIKQKGNGQAKIL